MMTSCCNILFVWLVATVAMLPSVMCVVGDDAMDEASSSITQRRSLEEISFQLRLDFDTSWRCIECEYGGNSGPSCREGDVLILDRCGSSERQRFIADGNRIMPLGSPELCITRRSDDIFLSECDDGDRRQLFYGLDRDDSFELYQGSAGVDDDDYCVAPDTSDPEKNEVLYAMDCDDSREFGTNKWELASIRNEEDDDDDDDEGGCGACIDLWEGNTLKKSNIKPITTRKDIEDFYDYNRDNYSFNGDDVVPLIEDHSLVFIHEHRSSCDLSLVIVHDSKDDSSGGTVRMQISGNLEDSVVQDGRDSPSDTYEYDSEDDETDCFWEWSWQSGRRYRTDGIADYWDPSERNRECRYIDADFIRGIDKWQFVPGPVPSSGKVDTADYITLNKNRRLWICKCDEIPDRK